MRRFVVAAGVLALVLNACGSSDSGAETDAQFKEEITSGMQSSLQGDLDALVQSAKDLQAAAPDHAWDDKDPAYARLQTAWINARHAYEHVEGATAPIFPNIDISIDGRVEDFGPDGTTTLTPASDMFGDEGMTGLHAVERILYSNVTPAAVVAYETGLRYAPPQSFPKTDHDASDFKNKLCAKLVADAIELQQGWQPTNIDIGSAFNGLISLMNEQKEKVTKAGLHQEESRYSQRTMDDLRENLLGTAKIYRLFEGWVRSKSGGADVDRQIQAGFDGLTAIYNSPAYRGNAFPAAPDDWSDMNPTAYDLGQPFGKLYEAVLGAVDPNKKGSIVFEMNAAATSCGLPPFNDG